MDVIELEATHDRVAEEFVSFVVPSRALVRSIPGCIEDEKGLWMSICLWNTGFKQTGNGHLSRPTPFFWRRLIGVDEECSTAERLPSHFFLDKFSIKLFLKDR